MSILTVSDLSISFAGRSILENVSFRLLSGEHVGLVGANGEGKSTFLKLVTGQSLPDQGKIEWCNRISWGYLDQYALLDPNQSIMAVLQSAFSEYYKLEKEMLADYDKMANCSEAEMNKLLLDVGEIQDLLEHSGFYSLDAKIKEIANGLGLLDLGLDHKIGELSGGQRTKVLLAKLLLQNPKILILDEPTNFLDAEHISWLQGFLQNYENAFILVSHDTDFMNAVVNVIYHVEQGRLTRYTGDYDNYLRMAEINKQKQLQAYNKQQKEIAQLEDFIARNKARIATRNMAQSRQKKLAKMEMVEKPKEQIKPSFSFQSARTPGKIVIDVKDLVIGYTSPLTRPLNFQIERNEKIAINGTNGLGKTTLLRTLLGELKPLSGSVTLDQFVESGFFEQEDEGEAISALDELWAVYPHATNQEIRAMLARCGLTKQHIETMMFALSGGEKAKVRLAKIMNKPCNLLLLDEPTNHLDVMAKAELARALQAYKGTIVLVSHDPTFYSGFVNRVLNIEDYTTKLI
ncbi:ABC-F family ATP-binding cassette domain-containing protein [Amygdalobacter nucleatus]|uniref:ABC transporter, ATP-binding protein n=1 Tax=Amygdalobacter nucleatus TaxID=3029274 RepID=A0A133YFI9_9FIRM|nr:ABC-F family ATP-binding cassette domain-containing protein [Amygdalobacter nucleatus]KXB41956.1 ABC transporter, ATP-binding protein [Amygdalobacter nucleatus]MDF0485720.1 ABC-F family ATP-binding cassette domain-containing protein [Amygdalobacter nucleatus]